MSNRPNSGNTVDMTVEGCADLEGAEPDLLEHLLVVAELRGAKDFGLDHAGRLLVDPLDELRAGFELHAAWRIGGAEADLDLLCLQCTGKNERANGTACGQRFLSPHIGVLPDAKLRPIALPANAPSVQGNRIRRR